ncbi:MAG: hypothetical protein V4773_13135 [Verrucomicrobiota bacterium]
MIATAILLVGFIGLIQAVTIGSHSLDTARRVQVATQLISAEIEKLRGGPWSAIANIPITPNPPSITISSTGVISGDRDWFALSNYTSSTAADDNTTLSNLARGFTCTLTRTYLRPASATASTVTFVKLSYTVTWKSGPRLTHKHTMETYLGKNGLHLSYQQS